MKKIITTLFTGLTVGLCLCTFAQAGQELQSGEFTVIKNSVNHGTGSTKTSAKINDKIDQTSSVGTETNSMAELTFGDTSISRMGYNSTFSFNSKERVVKLDKGTLLIHTPPGSGGVTVDGGGVTAAVTGTTIMAARDDAGNFGFLVLEGSMAKITTKDGKVTETTPGQMISVPVAAGEPKVAEIHLDAFRDYAMLYQNFENPLPGSDKVQAIVNQQSDEIQSTILFLINSQELGLSHSDPLLGLVGMMVNFSPKEVEASRNLFLGSASTAAGRELLEGSSGGRAGGSLLFVKGSLSANDSRENGADVIVAASMPPGTDTAAGGGDAPGGGSETPATDTAAGVNAAPDTQPPAPLSPRSGPTPGLATPI